MLLAQASEGLIRIKNIGRCKHGCMCTHLAQYGAITHEVKHDVKHRHLPGRRLRRQGTRVYIQMNPLQRCWKLSSCPAVRMVTELKNRGSRYAQRYMNLRSNQDCARTKAMSNLHERHRRHAGDIMRILRMASGELHGESRVSRASVCVGTYRVWF